MFVWDEESAEEGRSCRCRARRQRDCVRLRARLQVAADYVVRQLNAKPLRGTTVNRAMATAIERAIHEQLERDFVHVRGSGNVDLPDIGYDIKVTSSKQPRSSAAYAHGAEKIFGLSHGIVLLIYDGDDGRLRFERPLVFSREHTADRRLTSDLRAMLGEGATRREVVAYQRGAALELPESELAAVAERVLREGPADGQLIVSAALQ